MPFLFIFSVVMQPEGQHHGEHDPKDESEALQEPHVAPLVGLSSRGGLLGVRGGLAPVCSAAADLREDVHRGHVKESPS